MLHSNEEKRGHGLKELTEEARRYKEKIIHKKKISGTNSHDILRR